MITKTNLNLALLIIKLASTRGNAGAAILNSRAIINNNKLQLSSSISASAAAAAACFISVAAKLQAVDAVGSHRNLYKLGFFGDVYFVSGVGCANVDNRAAFLAVRSLYYLFFNAGRCSATFFILSGAGLYADAIAINYAILKRFGKNSFLNNTTIGGKSLSIARATKYLAALSLDFVFVIDTSISAKQLSALSNGRFFTIGVSAKLDAYRYFDNIIPVNATTAEMQYYFTELALSALFSGNRQQLAALTAAKQSAVTGLLKAI